MLGRHSIVSLRRIISLSACLSIKEYETTLLPQKTKTIMQTQHMSLRHISRFEQTKQETSEFSSRSNSSNDSSNNKCNVLQGQETVECKHSNVNLNNSLKVREKWLESIMNEDAKIKQIKKVKAEVVLHLTTLQRSFECILDDRRAIYRDEVVVEKLEPSRVAIADLLLYLRKIHINRKILQSSEQEEKKGYDLEHNKEAPNMFQSISEAGQELERCETTKNVDLPKFGPLTHELVEELKTAWLSEYDYHCSKAIYSSENNVVSNDNTNDHKFSVRCVETLALQELYTLILSSALITCDADIRRVLSIIVEKDKLIPISEMYCAIFTSLLLCCQGTSVENGQHVINRAEVGNLAGYYFGHAIRVIREHHAQEPRSFTTEEKSISNDHVVEETIVQHNSNKMINDMWSGLFVICALCQVAPSLMDLWWSKFIQESHANSNTIRCNKGHTPITDTNNVIITKINSKCDVSLPLPFTAVHAAMSWAAAQRDVERALTFLKTADAHGIILTVMDNNKNNNNNNNNVNISETDAKVDDNIKQELVVKPHTLLTRHDSFTVQYYQLKLLAKLAATAKILQMDGGLREIAVHDIKRLISPETLHAAPWSVINDVLSSLSLPSAMQLIKFISVPLTMHSSSNSNFEKEAGEELKEEESVDNNNNKKKNNSSNNNNNKNNEKQSSIPFYIWASLLRRCAREHHIDEAEALFTFIRKQSSLTAFYKRELVEIMMRMYATLPIPDYASTLELFVSHVVHHPEHEPAIQPDLPLYQLLLRAANSRNASMMSFLEGCADGVGFDHATFELLLSSHPFKTIASLTQKLPNEYPSSSLDAQLRLPANVDAHLRREEALQLRNKPLYDSTGDVGESVESLY